MQLTILGGYSVYRFDNDNVLTLKAIVRHTLQTCTAIECERSNMKGV